MITIKPLKNFKLDEEGEAINTFNRSKMEGWKNKNNREWNYRTNEGLWNKYSSRINSFLHHRRKGNIDDVYSEYCHLISSESPKNRAWLLKAWRKYYVEFNVITVGGKTCRRTAQNGYYTEITPWKNRSFFTMEGSKVLHLKMKEKKDKRAYSLPSLVEINADLVFSLEAVTYNRKIACGVLKPVVEYCWFKTYNTYHADSSIRMTLVKNPDGTRTIIYEAVPFVRKDAHKRTASKKELKEHKLTKENK